MMPVIDTTARNARARLLQAAGLNGVDFALVKLLPTGSPTHAILELHCFNDNHLDDIVTEIAALPPTTSIWSILRVTGGERYIAGPMQGQVQVTSVQHTGTGILACTITPIGDYSFYTFTILDTGFDPILSEFQFRFRPGCFGSDCDPPPMPLQAAVQPKIDYLAKDYSSFQHVMTAAMMERLPDWQSVSEADFDQVLIDLFSAAADELSDFQDRVMNEAYLAYARKRISLRRHARLMDYYIYEGNQASTVLAIDTHDGVTHTITPNVMAWTGPSATVPSGEIFVSNGPATVYGPFGSISMYTWSGVVPALAAGATTADLFFASAATASQFENLVNTGQITRLLIEEELNPLTGLPADSDPSKRQVLHLLTNATAAQDPLTLSWLVTVNWQDEDELTENYCFTVDLATGTVTDVSLFHANLVDLVQGAPTTASYYPASATLPQDGKSFYYMTLPNGVTICRLPNQPVLWKNTGPGGQTIPQSTLTVSVNGTPWTEEPDLIHSLGTDPEFVVEVDEDLRALVRFGDGTNGDAITAGAVIECNWLSGLGEDGNVGKNSLVQFNAPVPGSTCWNPFDATDGLPPETPATILRRVPEAYMYDQARAITLADYAQQAETVPGVRAAVASYAWTGSWRTVHVCVEPVGTFVLSETLRAAVEQTLEALHLIGEDTEVRPPELVPLNIEVTFCVSPDHWIEEVLPVVTAAFSSGYTLDGLPAFFNPANWTFGQALYASQIEGVLQGIEGVDHVVSISMSQWNAPWIESSEVMAVAPSQIVEVMSDPNEVEHGWIQFNPQGGRQ